MPLKRLYLNFVDGEQVLAVPVPGREDDGLVQEVVDGTQQLLPLLDLVAHSVEFLQIG